MTDEEEEEEEEEEIEEASSLLFSSPTQRSSSSRSSWFSTGSSRRSNIRSSYDAIASSSLLSEHQDNDDSNNTATLTQPTNQHTTTTTTPTTLWWETYYPRHVQLLVTLGLFSYVGEYLRYVTEYVFGNQCQSAIPQYWDVHDWTVSSTVPYLFLKTCTIPITTTMMEEDATNSYYGTIFVTDLIPNMIGCFIMGLLVSGDGESVVINLPVAIFPRSSFFQNWIVTHVGLRTGLCGAFTTFASWNTSLVVMLFTSSASSASGNISHSDSDSDSDSDNSDKDTRSSVSSGSARVAVVLGYLIGLYTAIQAYQFGTTVAYAVSRYFNHHLAVEADHLQDKHDHHNTAATKSSTTSPNQSQQQQPHRRPRVQSILVNRGIPDFERRFLHSICMNTEELMTDEERTNTNLMISYPSNCMTGEDDRSDTTGNNAYDNGNDNDPYQDNDDENNNKDAPSHRHNLLNSSQQQQHLHHLQAWKESTKKDRDFGRRTLQDIEKYFLVDKIHPRQELLDIARDAGWDVGSLQNWASALDDGNNRSSTASANSTRRRRITLSSPIVEACVNLILFVICTGSLLYGFIQCCSNNYNNNDDITKKSAARYLSSLLAPLGTYSRWYLSRLNGTIHNPKYEWIPIGTFLANMIASIVSVFAVGMNNNISNSSHVENAIMKTMIWGAIKAGYAGSFSTVSTFVAETQGLFRALPRHFWGHYYSLGSLILAFIVGSVSYRVAIMI